MTNPKLRREIGKLLIAFKRGDDLQLAIEHGISLFKTFYKEIIGKKYRRSKWGGYTHPETIGRALNEKEVLKTLNKEVGKDD